MNELMAVFFAQNDYHKVISFLTFRTSILKVKVKVLEIPNVSNYLFRALALRDSESTHSDKGLKLETSVFESFSVANLPY